MPFVLIVLWIKGYNKEKCEDTARGIMADSFKIATKFAVKFMDAVKKTTDGVPCCQN